MAPSGLSPRRFRSLPWVLALGLLTGCANGDFGRLKPQLVSDDMHAWIGRQAAGSAGVPPSRYELTDDERELRDLAFPLIEPPFDRQRWDSVVREYGIIRSRPETPFNRTRYGNELMTASYRSAESRYERLIEDIRNDITRTGPFLRTAGRVADMDGKREQSLAYILDLNADERANAMSRMAENRLVIDWVHQSLAERTAAYRFALERLVAAYPSPKAADAERLCNQLRASVEGNPGVAVLPLRRADVELSLAK